MPVLIAENIEPDYMTETLQPLEDGETSWEEVKDVFKSTSGNKPWMPGKPFTKTELATFLNEPVKQANSGQTLTLADVQKNVQQLKATHTHGS